MLFAITAGLLALVLVLGWIFTPKNTGIEFLAGACTMVLFPVAVILGVLSLVLSTVGGIFPSAASSGAVLATYVDGANGIEGWAYAIVSLMLWVAVLLQLGDVDADSDAVDSDVTNTAADTATNTTDSTQGPDLEGVNGVGPAKAKILKNAGYHSVEDLQSAPQSELADVSGIGNALAAYIKKDVGSLNGPSESTTSENDGTSDGESSDTTTSSDESSTAGDDKDSDTSSEEEPRERSDINTEAKVIEDVQAVAEESDGLLDESSYEQQGWYSVSAIEKQFGSWEALLKEAFDEHYLVTIDGNLHARSTSPRTAYIDAITSVAASTDKPIKSTDVSDQSPYSVNEIVGEFGSWQDALEAAEVDNESRLLEELRRVTRKLGHKPSTSEMDDHGYVSSGMYADYFGSYTNALDQALEEDDSLPPTDDVSAPEKADYIEAIQEVADNSDRPIKSTEVRDQTEYSVNKIIAEFGSWDDALDAAGVDNRSRMIADIERVAEKLGHLPSSTEMNEHGHVSATTISNYFGAYSDAREAASQDNGEPTDERQGTKLDSNEDRLEQTSSESESVGESAVFVTIGGITEDRRLKRPIALNVIDVVDQPDDQKEAHLVVEDLAGDRCRLNIWRKHEVNVHWDTGHWYILDHARGKQWTNSRGESNRQLSSTRDLEVQHVGTDRLEGRTLEPTEESKSTGDDAEPRETEQTSGQNTTQSTESAGGDSDSIDEDTSDESGGDEKDGILGEVVSEFDDENFDVSDY